MLFGTNNVTNHEKENAKRKMMQGEPTTRTEFTEDIEAVAW